MDTAEVIERWRAEEEAVRAHLSKAGVASPRDAIGKSGLGSLTRYRDEGQIEIDAERALRDVSLGRKNFMFRCSDAGAERAAAIYSLMDAALCRALLVPRRAF